MKRSRKYESFKNSRADELGDVHDGHLGRIFFFSLLVLFLGVFSMGGRFLPPSAVEVEAMAVYPQPEFEEIVTTDGARTPASSAQKVDPSPDPNSDINTEEEFQPIEIIPL